MKHLDKIFYATSLGACVFGIIGCFPQEVLKQAPDTGATLISNVPQVIANPANGYAWYHIVGALAIVFAAGFGGPTAVAKVKSFFADPVSAVEKTVTDTK